MTEYLSNGSGGYAQVDHARFEVRSRRRRQGERPRFCRSVV